MKLKSFFTEKETVTRLKKAYRRGENFASSTFGKELITTMYREMKK
jgi:hypothetical protein